jgi:uroporphyrin-III C-methyltransferase
MKGKVFFVGAGPGAADLLTVRAVRVLQHADIVLHDELVPADLVDFVSPAATIVNVGKRCGQAGTSQETLNSLMIRYARENRCVVRLKCGDPSVFGRLGEEIEALRKAGISFEIVPGITAALAAAASAQISLTDRRIASRVVFATASLTNGARQDWRECVGSKTTVVIYMPGRDCRALCTELMQAGIGPELPCLVVSRAAAYNEESYRMTVSQLAEFQPPESPSVVIVGEVVRNACAAQQSVISVIEDLLHKYKPQIQSLKKEKTYV